MEATLNIKSFGDYRDFLKAHFELKRTANPAWSYGLWSKRLGLKATSSLTKVMTGEREPGKSITEKFVAYFSFTQDQASYFSDLIRLSKIKDDPRLSIMVMEKMGREHPDATLKIIDDKSFAIISNWFCMTIREMVRLWDFQEDPEWIQGRLRHEVSCEEIRQAIKDLLHQGLVVRDATGKLKPQKGLLHTTNDIASEGIKLYHEQMLERAKQAIRSVDVNQREYSAETLTLNSSRLPEAKELIREFKAKFARLFEEQVGDETFQLQIQLFPLTKELRDENDDF